MRRSRGFGVLLFAWVLLLGAVAYAQGQIGVDSDHDGLSDAREQALLERFVPRFQVSRTDCAVKPALFEEGVAKPTVMKRDGTIYGQVTPRVSAKGDAVVEVHYYDLWSADCGRMGHPLDAEHVSVLLRAKTMDGPAEDWRAVYWFAAAHEATVCDASEVAAAKVLDAESQGATVWLSAGKHGAFLSEAICMQGCGGDRCIEMAPLVVARVINVGEPGVAMHGAVWVQSAAWPLAAKMQSDFSAAAIARLEQGGGVPVEMNGAHGSVKGTIYVANSVANGVGTSAANTGDALSTAGVNTGTALDDADAKTEGALTKGAKATGNALKKSTKAVGRFLHLTGEEKGRDTVPRLVERLQGFYTAGMGKFYLRVATVEDVAGIRGLIDASVRGLQAGDYSAAQIEGALATVFTVDSQLIADGSYFVAFAEGGELAGCGGWSFRKTLYGGDHQIEKIASERLDPAVDAAKVRAIFVHPKFARMGLGSLILAAAEGAAIEDGFRRFEMGSTLTGVALYMLKGYREVSRVSVPVGGGETIEVVRMVKSLVV